MGGGVGVTEGEEAGEAGEAVATRAGAELWAVEDELEEREEAGRMSWSGGSGGRGRSDGTGGIRAGVGVVASEGARAGGGGVVEGGWG